MIAITKSENADTRTCDFANVSKYQLTQATQKHRSDVSKALAMFGDLLQGAGSKHDLDKLSGMDHFHADFITGFEETGWWDDHRKVTRHHLGAEDGIPSDVNLIDVLEMVADCVMAGMARAGSVYPLVIAPEVLKRAVDNTVELLRGQIVVNQDGGGK